MKFGIANELFEICIVLIDKAVNHGFGSSGLACCDSRTLKPQEHCLVNMMYHQSFKVLKGEKNFSVRYRFSLQKECNYISTEVNTTNLVCRPFM